MDAILDPVRDWFEGTTDFKGQIFADELSTFFLYVSTMIAVVAGFVNGDIFITLWTGLGLTMFTMLIVVPAWPIFRRHPVRFLGSTTILPAEGIVVGSKKVQ